MGANLVAKVLAGWTHVSDRAFRVLVRMALTALDKPREDQPADHYFAGRELLAMTLRSDGGTEQSRYRVVARVIAELIEAGAIQRADGGRTGHNAVYRLTLDNARSARKRPDKGGRISHPQGGQISHPQGGQFGPERVINLATPRNQEEPLEELSEERRGLSETASHPPRASEPSEKAPNVFPIRGRRDHVTDALTEASARVAARKAEHQARLASGETT